MSLRLLETDDCDDKNNSNPSSVVSVVLSEESTLILAEKKNNTVIYIYYLPLNVKIIFLSIGINLLLSYQHHQFDKHHLVSES